MYTDVVLSVKVRIHTWVVFIHIYQWFSVDKITSIVVINITGFGLLMGLQIVIILLIR